MYELVTSGFGDMQHVAIAVADYEENVNIVHHFPVNASAMDAMTLLGAINDAYERGYAIGQEHCEVTHEKPKTAWYADHVGGPAMLKSERKSAL